MENGQPNIIPQLATIQQDFINAALAFPNNNAIWTDNGEINYSDLLCRSNLFSKWLLDNNHAPHKRTALILPKSIDNIVALFGALMAGNTYVPLGSTWPANRLNTIIENGEFDLILQDKSNPDLIINDASSLLLDSEQWQSIYSVLENASEDQLNSIKADKTYTVKTTDIAYILYTSGSTGVPKGVTVSHSAAQFFPAWAKKEFNVDETHRIASMAPFTFDLSTFDIFTGLSSGGCLYIIPEKFKMFPTRLSGFLEKHEITTLYAVPSALSLMALNGNLGKRDFSHFKALLFAGEVFPIEVCRLFKSFLPENVQYYNLYGPTETNVCTYFDASDIPDGDQPLPIGKTLPEHSSFIDTDIGEGDNVGELCIYGPTLMSGYWGKSNEGAPYWTDVPGKPGLKAYRTGDVTYLDEKGNWIYKGRADKMVKIFGYRVELGEIESSLVKHEDVEQCVVVKRDRKSPDGSKTIGEELVAFIIPSKLDQERVTLNKIEIFKHCKNDLPHYMLPSTIYEIEEFPIGQSGKTDRLKIEQQAQDMA